jgi:hypothetical protein
VGSNPTGGTARRPVDSSSDQHELVPQAITSCPVVSDCPGDRRLAGPIRAQIPRVPTGGNGAAPRIWRVVSPGHRGARRRDRNAGRAPSTPGSGGSELSGHLSALRDALYQQLWASSSPAWFGFTRAVRTRGDEGTFVPRLHRAVVFRPQVRLFVMFVHRSWSAGPVLLNRPCWGRSRCPQRRSGVAGEPGAR